MVRTFGEKDRLVYNNRKYPKWNSKTKVERCKARGYERDKFRNKKHKTDKFGEGKVSIMPTLNREMAGEDDKLIRIIEQLQSYQWRLCFRQLPRTVPSVASQSGSGSPWSQKETGAS